MGTAVHNRTPKSTGRQSLFFQDLASPISTRKGRFSSPATASASTSWRENLGGSDLPPPPRFTLDDRSDFSPESGIPDYPVSPTEVRSDPRTPPVVGRDVVTPSRSGSFALNQQGSGSSSGWWALARGGGSGEQEKEGKGSPVEGVVKPGALVTVPPPREVARPEIVQRNPLTAGNLEEEEWVTVYGFPPGDTNLVLREFEKCGVILKHVPGPRDANWMHILYQNRSDAQKALSKNGMQINGVLIIGVKPVDPMQRQVLNERLNNQGFMPLPPSSSARTSDSRTLRATASPYHIKNGSTSSRQPGGVIASPAKSVVSKIFDVMFGI